MPANGSREALAGCQAARSNPCPGKGPNCFVAPAYALARFGGLARFAKLAQRAKAGCSSQ